jgi:hypothetical protein
VHDRWFNETAIDVANIISSGSVQIALRDKTRSECAVSWYRIDGNKYHATGLVFCEKKK